MKRGRLYLLPAALLLAALLLVPAAAVRAAKTVPSVKMNVLKD